MPRKRTFDPDIWRDEAFGLLSIMEMLCFMWQIMVADDEGLGLANPLVVRSEMFRYVEEKIPIFPPGLDPKEYVVFENGTAYLKINRALIWHVLQYLSKRSSSKSKCKMMRLYDVNDENFYHLPNFKKHQWLARRSPSKLPQPPDLEQREIEIHGKSQRMTGVDFVKMWNFHRNLPQVRGYCKQHEKKFDVLYNNDRYFRENFIEAIKKADRSSYLIGQNSTGFRINMGWFLEHDSVKDIVEGKYDDNQHAKESEGKKKEPKGKDSPDRRAPKIQRGGDGTKAV